MSWSSHLSSRISVGSRDDPGARHPGAHGGSFAQMSTSIDVVINGQARTIDIGTSVSVLLLELGLGDRRVAVERNREIVPRADHARTILAAGDRLELVTFVGGG